MRLLVLTGAMFVSSTVAGRLSTAVPVRLMISAGFVLIAAGIALMTGVSDTSSWTHLLPGMVVAGIGAGMVTVPLASTAVGVVAPAQAGTASGINATARQVGLATGIAALGTVFTSRSATSGFADGLNEILWIGAAVALAAAVLSAVLIRQRDFVSPAAAPAAGKEAPAAVADAEAR